MVTSDADLQFRTVHGYQRAFRRVGGGAPLLLIHGIGDESSSWLPVLGELAGHFDVLAPDLLGHGASDKPRADYSVAAFSNGMRDLLDVLEIDRVTVVGHSLGGGVAAQLAYQYPERVERLVLVGTGGVGREVSGVLRAAAMPYSEIGMLPLMVPGMSTVVGAALGVAGWFGADIGVDAGEVTRVLSGMPDRRRRVAFGRTLRAVVDRRGQLVTMLDRAYLAEGMPVLIVWGERDAIIPVEHGHRAHEAISGSELSVYEGAGHFPHHHDPERFVSELVRFVAETDPYEPDAGTRRTLLLKGRGGVASDEPPEPVLIG